MKQINLLLVTVTMVAAVALISALPLVHAIDVQSTVQLGTSAPTCGLAIVSGSPISYGSLTAANAISTDKILRIQNTGTTPGSITALGTHWLNPAVAAPNNVVMDVKTTHMGTVANQAYASKKFLGPTPFNIFSDPALGQTTLAGGASMDTFWQVQFVLNAGVTFSGSASQTVTLASSC
jgi:hypothetical protein